MLSAHVVNGYTSFHYGTILDLTVRITLDLLGNLLGNREQILSILRARHHPMLLRVEAPACTCFAPLSLNFDGWL